MKRNNDNQQNFKFYEEAEKERKKILSLKSFSVDIKTKQNKAKHFRCLKSSAAVAVKAAAIKWKQYRNNFNNITPTSEEILYQISNEEGGLEETSHPSNDVIR